MLVARTRVNDRRIAYLSEIGFPFVSFGRSDLDLDFAYVDEDGYKGLQLVVDHLVGLGHTRFAFISAPINLMFCAYRTAGLEASLEYHGLSLDPAYRIIGDLTQHRGFQAMDQLLDLSPPPTAVIACNDLMALGAISAAQKRGLMVGRDVAITGFDDIPLAEHSNPPLTTVHQPIYDIGRQTCAMLIQLIQGKDPPVRHALLQPELIIRESSGMG
jgi:LacI family transcriptional regulator